MTNTNLSFQEAERSNLLQFTTKATEYGELSFYTRVGTGEAKVNIGQNITRKDPFNEVMSIMRANFDEIRVIEGIEDKKAFVTHFVAIKND